jgi:hypothetical protein
MDSYPGLPSLLVMGTGQIQLCVTSTNMAIAEVPAGNRLGNPEAFPQPQNVRPAAGSHQHQTCLPIIRDMIRSTELSRQKVAFSVGASTDICHELVRPARLLFETEDWCKTAISRAYQEAFPRDEAALAWIHRLISEWRLPQLRQL